MEDFIIQDDYVSAKELQRLSDEIAIKAFNERIEQAIKATQELRERVQAREQKPFKQWELVKELCFFEKSPSMCLVHDDDYKDHTKKHYY